MFFFFSFLVIVIKGDDRLSTNGSVGKHHALKDVPSPYRCNRTFEILFTSSSLLTLNVTELYVSSTLYVSSQEIIVSWNSDTTSSVCKDEFICNDVGNVDDGDSIG